MSKPKDRVIIGCHSAFWGDSPLAAEQLVSRSAHLDYLVSDYLAEVTMALLARAKQNPQRRKTVPTGAGQGGFVTDFLEEVWKPLHVQILAKGIRVITNAGGMNPLALKAALEAFCREADVSPLPRIAAVVGDDVLGDALRGSDAAALRRAALPFETQPGEQEAWPPEGRAILSANAYLGAQPIVEALRNGAQIVVTGRCVDSALVLAPLIYEFGWRADQYDLLSAGSLAGHIVECGCQATGGNFTDWRASYAGGTAAYSHWGDVGFPVVECHPDGSFEVTKPPRTGGIVTVATVAEQMVYEIGDPQSYLLPDVVCDWSQVLITQLDVDRVRVTDARGRAPSPYYKVSATFFDGYRLSAELLVVGVDAADKARAVADGTLRKVRRLVAKRGLAHFRAVQVEVLGTEHHLGPHASELARASREVILRIAAQHDDVAALRLLGVEIAPAATSMAPGISGGGSGRPRPTPVISHFSFLLPKAAAPVELHVGVAAPMSIPIPACGAPSTTTCSASSVAKIQAKPKYRPPAAPEPSVAAPAAALPPSGELVDVPLVRLCFGRSGDKGDAANIGLIARDARAYALLCEYLTAARVADYMAHLARGTVHRYELPGIRALNFVLTRALGGGGIASLRIDRQAKTYAQIMLCMLVPVPREWALHLDAASEPAAGAALPAARL